MKKRGATKPGATKKPKAKKAVGPELRLEDKLILEAVERGEAEFRVISNTKPAEIKALPGHLLLIYGVGEDTPISALFDPFGLGEYFGEWCAEVLDDFLKSADFTMPAEAQAEWSRALTEFALRSFLWNLQPMIYQAMAEHEETVMVLVRGLIERTCRLGGLKGFPQIAEREAERLASQIRSERRSFLRGSLSRPKPDLLRLADEYARLLPIWQQASRTYKANKGRPTWEKIIRADQEGFDFPADLLARLPNRAADLSDELRAALERTNASNTPSHIAIEHAARLCGMADYAKSVSFYFRKIKGRSRPTAAEGVH